MRGPIRVLYVDDEPALLEIGRRFLELAGGMTIITVDSAKAALELLEREEVDVVVSDYQMPGMDGIRFLIAVRERFGRLPFILFTGRGREEIAIQAINNGVDFYLQKGGDPEAQYLQLAHLVRLAEERQSAGNALATSELRFRSLIQNSSDIIRIVDRDGRITYESDSGRRILGYPAGYTLGKSPLEFIHPDDLEQARIALGEVFEGRNPGTPTAVRVRRSDGTYIHVEAVGVNLIGTPGIDGVVITSRPIDERLVAERDLRQSEERFRRAEGIARIGHWQIDLKEGTVSASRGAQAILGLEGTTVTLASLEHCFDPVEYERIRQAGRELIDAGTPFDLEFRLRRADGQEIVVRTQAEYDREQDAIFGVLHDVTGLRESEAMLTRFGRILESSLNEIYIFDERTLRFIDVNRGARENLGYTMDELRQMTPLDLKPRFSASEFEALIAPLRSGEVEKQVFTTVHKRKDGSLYPVEVHLQLMRYGTSPVFVAVILDITGQVRANEALVRANRVLNLLSSITRHDITNQLVVLQGYLALLRSGVDDPVLREQVDRCQASAERIASMVRFAGTCEHLGLQAPAWQEVRALVDRAAAEVDLGAIRLENRLPAGLEISADRLIARVFTNLLDNVVRHGKGATVVRFSAEQGDGGPVIVCEDDGIGVPEEKKERIFERGYGDHTGFGLFLVREILQITGIAIRETGTPGEGARFGLSIPAEIARTRPIGPASWTGGPDA